MWLLEAAQKQSFRSVAHGIYEILWIKRLLEELKISNPSPMKVYRDNKAAISIAHNSILHDKTMQVEVDKHFIKEKIEKGIICIPYVPQTEQVANIFTNELPKKQFYNLIGKLAMEDIYK